MTRRVEDGPEGRLPQLTMKRRIMVMASSALATFAAALLLFTAFGLWTYNSPGPAARQGAQTNVVLRHGASLAEIASTLQTSGVIRSSPIFVAAAQVTGASRALKAGEYAFPSGISLGRVMRMIRDGEIVRHYVTIPEGVTSEQAVAILTANTVLTGSAPTPAEGSILPETYEVQRGADRAAVLQRMMNARDKLLAELWPRRRPDLPFQTPEEAVTLASIVEKETAQATERPRVAAVFVNRLVKGMPLASDPTIIYGLTKGVPLGRGIRQSEIAAPTPYNTYHFAGLTPTPICNPGRASIAAVLDPPRTNELYFVANGPSSHAFAATAKEHEANVARWRVIEQQLKQQAGAGGAPAASPAEAMAAQAPAGGPGIRGAHVR